MKEALTRSTAAPDKTARHKKPAALPTSPETSTRDPDKAVPPTESDKLRSALLPLLLGPEQLTATDIFTALDAVYPTVKLKRQMSIAPSNRSRKNAVYPKLTLAGKYLEDGGLRYGKEVTVRTGANFVLVTVDNPGPDPAIEQTYARTKARRQEMKDIYDKLFYGMPLWKIHEYAIEMKGQKAAQPFDPEAAKKAEQERPAA